MRRVRRHGTSAELRMRAVAKAAGAHYRLNVKGLPGTPDLANKARRKAVFVNGCFWHGHEHCTKARLPKRNRDFWTRKIEDNIARDARKVAALEALGFEVLVVWECELRNPNALVERFRRFWSAPTRVERREVA